MSETISQFPSAATGNLSDIFLATQDSIGPGTGTTRGITPLQFLNQEQDAAASATPTIASFSRDGNSKTDQPIFSTSWTINTSGGSPLNQTINNTTVNATPAEFWAHFDNMSFEGPSTAGAGLVTRYVQATSAENRHSTVPIWAMVTSTVDFTGNPSATSGGMFTQEIDLEASGLDNGTGSGVRRIVQIIGFSGRDYGGSDSEISEGMLITTAGVSGANIHFKRSANIGGRYNDACLLLNGIPSSSVKPQLALPAGGLVSFDYPDNLATLAYNGTTFAVTQPIRNPGYSVAQIAAMTFSPGDQGTMLWCNNALNADGLSAGCLVTVDNTGEPRAEWSGLPPTT